MSGQAQDDRSPADVEDARLRAALTRLGRDDLTLRAVRDADGAALTALVSAVYDEYACGPLDPDGFDADLARPASSAAERGRRWWVVTERDAPAVGAETLVASVALSGLRAGADGLPVRELHRLYLAPDVRGAGLASSLVAAVADVAQTSGAVSLEAWSDTRLVDAHARYLVLGFVLSGASRELHDPAGTCELQFVLPLEH